MRTLTRAGATLVGLLVGLLSTEALFMARDHAAFPHLNLYLPDASLGVRLMPSSHERIRFGGNPTSTIHVNAQGYRGEDWPTQSPGGPKEILVVGDSQVFGLGVEDSETHPARLAVHAGRPVINGGVPTYGPREYLSAAEEILSGRDSIDTLVVIFNFSNDLFEIDRPNHERHAVWDGWAVRIETAPASVNWFPGRDWLYRRSHAFFALRQLVHRSSQPDHVEALPSEGAPLDVVFAASESAARQRESRDDVLISERRRAFERYEQAVAALGGEPEMLRLFGYTVSSLEEFEASIALQAYVGNKHPGDIVGNPYAEGARPVEVTAEMLSQGAAVRREMRDRLRTWAEANPEHEVAGRIFEALRSGSRLDPSLAGEALPDLPMLGSPLDAVLDEAKRLADKHGVELAVVALPLDVQVSETQWQKYGLPPRDLSDTRVLIDDLGLSCANRSIRFLDALPPLKELGDKAFLDGDLHLTPAGQDHLARAIAETLAAPVLPPPPGTGLPEGRSRIPSREEWLAARESIVRGSGRNRCSTREIREWLVLDCEATPPDMFKDGEIILVDKEDSPQFGAVSGPLEVFGWRDADNSVLYVPLLPGREVSVRYRWPSRSERLSVTWNGERHTAAFVQSDEALDPGAPMRELMPTYTSPEGYEHSDQQFFGSGPADCANTYTQKPSFMNCALGMRLELPTCPTGLVNAGSAGHCFALCGDKAPCASGVCTPWQGSSVCL